MNFTDYFVKGLKNTLKIKNAFNWSWKGTEIAVPDVTVIDEWHVGEFSTATYEVIAEYGVNDVEHITVVVTGRVAEAAISVYGRSNLGKDLVSFSASVDNSRVQVKATPLYQADKVTKLTGVKLSYKATYIEKIIPSAIPTVVGPSDNLGGEAGIGKNWESTDFPDGFLDLNASGSIAISNLHKVSVPGQSDLISDFILTKLRLAEDDSITLTSNATTNTLTASLNYIASLNITHSLNMTPALTGSINNVAIGQTSAVAGTFTTLNATGTVSLSSLDQAVGFLPTGTGTVTVAPATTPGTIDRVSIGQTVPKAGTFTNLGTNGIVSFSSPQTVTMTPTGAVTFNPTQVGSIDNTVVGASIPATGRFTTITILNPSTAGDQLVTLSQLQSILLGASR